MSRFAEELISRILEGEDASTIVDEGVLKVIGNIAKVSAATARSAAAMGVGRAADAVLGKKKPGTAKAGQSEYARKCSSMDGRNVFGRCVKDGRILFYTKRKKG